LLFLFLKSVNKGYMDFITLGPNKGLKSIKKRQKGLKGAKKGKKALTR